MADIDPLEEFLLPEDTEGRQRDDPLISGGPLPIDSPSRKLT